MEKGLPQEFFQEITEKNDIVAVISEYVTLKRAGRSMLGLCPFHSEKTPSFNVNAAKQLFYCFGCGAGGNVIHFIMKIENLGFLDATRRLAERSGIAWPETSSGLERDPEKEALYNINKLAASFFNYCLIKTEPGQKAAAYLTKRGISPESWTRFNLGYAPPSWHHLTELLRKKNIPLGQAEVLGLVSIGEKGYYDRFRDRLIFPVNDARGNGVGFGGRVFDDSHPKYLNSPESVIFHKGNLWFGLHLAKESIRKKNQALIVEGYMDVIQAHQGGFTQTIASLGTSLTKEQARLLKRYTSEAVLAYDGDSAGQQATIRGMEILQEAGLTVRIIQLPPGDDPDSLIKDKGAAEFQKLIDQAVGFIDFKIGLALKQFNLLSPEGQSGAVGTVLPLLDSVANTIAREAYVRRLAREIGISETAILTELQTWRQKNRKKSLVLDRNDNKSYTNETTEKKSGFPGFMELSELSPTQQVLFKVEKELLQQVLQEYNKLTRIKEELKTEEFNFSIWRDLFDELSRCVPSPERENGVDQLRESMREVAAALLAEKQVMECAADLDGLISRWKMLTLQEHVQSLANQITSGRSIAGDLLSDDELRNTMIKFNELKRRLQKEYPSFSAGI